MTDKEIKDRLFRLWCSHIDKNWCLAVLNAMNWKYSERTISEIKDLMQNDGIELSEINKIIFGG
jgi:hypothetical protein